MNDPHDARWTQESPPPWQLELDAEIEDPREREELRALVSLLRSLPDPDVPEELLPTVLERVAAREARPVVVRAAGRFVETLAEPRVTVALAAGIACLLAIASFDGASISWPVSSDSVAPTSPATAVGPTVVVGNALPRVHRPTPVGWRSPAVVHPQIVSLMNIYPQPATPWIRLGPPRLEESNLLDQQLNRLLLDPTAFCERLERVAEPDAFIARLADRAAQRGDAAQVALRVRQAQHPMGPKLVDRFLQASVAHYSPHH